MSSGVASYTTKELSRKTWPDLEKLFTRPGIGDAWWCWCTFHHTARFTRENTPRTRGVRAARNRQEKKQLVEKREAHGILVYAKDEPVGWCQYGRREELPRVDHSRNYRNFEAAGDGSFWRITCFVVDKNYRRRGVASAGLKAALEAIGKKGGGVVEAYPVSRTDQGPGYMYTGRVSMFAKAGFKMVTRLGTGRTSTVVMRRTI
jgi:ribosomal protein S18 acetylase RimI-like enzyme